MKLPAEDRDLLNKAKIGMLALHGRTHPVVNPTVFHFADESIWMTTSRFASKVRLVKKNPRGAFLVTAPGRSILLQGVMESFDLRSISGQIRAALRGPSFYTSLAGYAVKNLPFVGGYLLEIDRVPMQWWPQNRLVLRLRVQRARSFESPADVPADPASLPAIPKDVARRLARVSLAHACWREKGGLTLQPCYWNSSDSRLAIAFDERSADLAEGTVPAAVVIQSHHPFRPTRMVGASFRGALETDRKARAALADRYSPADAEFGGSFCLDPVAVTFWRGFASESHVQLRA